MTYTTDDGREWDLDEEYTANGFHYRWDGSEFGDSGPLMAAVGRDGVFVRLESLAKLDGQFRDADVAEGAVPDHDGDPTVCARCRVLRGEDPLPALPAADDTVEMALPMRGAA